MPSSRRLADQERRQIAQQRAKGVPERELAVRFSASRKTIYNALNHGLATRSANDSRPRALTIRVSDRDLRGFDAALSRRGIAHRSDAMRRLMLAADDLLRPDEVMTEELRAMSAALNPGGQQREPGGAASERGQTEG
jgi:hypothetical protein